MPDTLLASLASGVLDKDLNAAGAASPSATVSDAAMVCDAGKERAKSGRSYHH